MKQTFTVQIESDRKISEETVKAVLAQDLTGGAKDGSGIQVTEETHRFGLLGRSRSVSLNYFLSRSISDRSWATCSSACRTTSQRRANSSCFSSGAFARA